MESKIIDIGKNVCQYEEVKGSDVKRACGSVCLCIVLNYLGVKVNSQYIFDKGVELNGLLDVGWKHSVLCKIARDYGIPAYSQEFKSEKDNLFDIGVDKLKRSIDSGSPVIISVKHKDRDGSHMIVLVGYDSDKFYISDPEFKEDKVEEISKDEFKRRWRKLAIFFV